MLSARHRCFKRPGMSRLPDIDGDKPAKKQCNPSAMGDVPLAIAEVRTAEGQLSLFVAIDRVGTFASAAWHAAATTVVAAQCLRYWIAAVPDKIHPVLPDHGLQFTNRQRDQDAFPHRFERVCQEHGSDHRLPTTTHPWTHGPVERLTRTCKDTPGKTSHDPTPNSLQEPLQAFRRADNFATRLKTLNGLTPDAYSCQDGQQEPDRFTVNPSHHTLELNI
jgi:hypothetical protein